MQVFDLVILRLKHKCPSLTWIFLSTHSYVWPSTGSSTINEGEEKQNKVAALQCMAAYHESGKAEGGTAKREERSSRNILSGAGRGEEAERRGSRDMSVGGEAERSGACRRGARERREERREWASLPAFSHAPSAIVRPEDAAREGWWMRRKGWGRKERRDESLSVQRCDYLKGWAAAGGRKNSLRATWRLVSAANLVDGAFERGKKDI